jgi:hypothetical protein
MEDEREITDEESLLRKAKLVESYAAAKARLHSLQDAARTEQKVLNGIVEYLRGGGDCRQGAKTLESYLTYTLANLIRDMWAVCIEMDELERKLSGLGTVPN